MLRKVTQLGLIGFCCCMAGCCGAPPPPIEIAATEQPDTEPEHVKAVEPEKSLLIDPPIWMSAADVKTDCEKRLQAAKTIKEEITAVTETRTVQNTLEPLNNIVIELGKAVPVAELMANTHPAKEVRDAAEKCQQDLMKFWTALELNREVYDAVKGVDGDSLEGIDKRFYTLLMRDYRRTGVDKDEETRKKLAALKDAMVKTGQDFGRAIREDKHTLTFSKSDLAGLPEDFITAHAQGETYTVTTDYPDFFPVVTYADSEKVRQDLYLEFLRRAYPKNKANLKKLLELRYEYATILGYEDWASYNAEDKMVKNKETILKFIDDVTKIARPRMKEDLKQFLKRKKKDNKKSKEIHVWDRFYYANKIRAEEYGVDAKEVRSYFEFTKVKEGILALAEKIFQMKFEKVEDTLVWHEDVEAYNALENGEIVGRFYLDMHPREGKYKHAAEFPMITGIAGRQVPSVCLVCNFPKPSENTRALMEHDDVVTFLHEFGHMMHQIIAGRHKWASLSGIACEWDFVEAPSQLLEHWGWDFDILSSFAVHTETGKTIPKQLVTKMYEADKLGRGTHTMRQMFYASLSIDYHLRNPKDIVLLDVVKENQKKYSPFPYEKDTYVYANFGHLEGYSSMYYTYMWSLMLSEDMFSRFKSEGLMNPKTAQDYRKAVLEPGGTVDAIEMVKNFLGREPNFEALKAYLEEK